MVKLDAQVLRYMTKDEFRILTAVEMGMKNHEIVSTELICRIAGLKKGGGARCIGELHKNKLLFHDASKYDGYRLTAVGYDYLALQTFVKRGMITGLGRRIGVGKESDIYEVVDDKGEAMVLKVHRLGRTSFRSIKNNRDYLQHRSNASWLYLSRIAATREFAYMKALYERDFPVPIPYDQNRHCVLMSKVDAFPLSIVTDVRHPGAIYSDLMSLIVRLAQHGLIHGDFNEFNLMINNEEQITLIDFPQMVSTSHENAQYYFDRDVQCVRTFFLKRFQFDGAEWPRLLADTKALVKLDVEIAASGHDAEELDSAGVDEFLRVALNRGRDVGSPYLSDGEEDDEADEGDSEMEEEEEEAGLLQAAEVKVDLEEGPEDDEGDDEGDDECDEGDEGDEESESEVKGSRARKLKPKPVKSIEEQVRRQRALQELKQTQQAQRRLYRRNTARSRKETRAIREQMATVDL